MDQGRRGSAEGLLGFDAKAARRTIASRMVLVVFVCLLADFLLLTVVIPYVPQLLSNPPPEGVGEYSSMMIGLLFASKPIVQIATNPVAGVLTERAGPRRLLAVSTLVMAVSACGFALASTFAALFVARAVQGAASAATMTAGMSLLCELHATKVTRAEAMGNAMGGMALGVLTGPLLGGVLFQHFGQAAPMLFVVATLVLSVGAQLHTAKLERAVAVHEAAPRQGEGRHGYGHSPGEDESDAEAPEGHTPIMTVFGDPLFLTVGLALVAANAVIGMLEPLFQLWAAAKFNLNADYRGLVWSASTLGYLVGTPAAGMLAAKHADHKRFLLAAGLAVMAASLPLFASAPGSWSNSASLGLAAAALCFVGCGMALVDVPSQPLLADVADFRQLPGYGVAFSVADVSASLGFVVGPLLGGAISDHMTAVHATPGIELACLVFAALAVLVAPLVATALAQAEHGTSEKVRRGAAAAGHVANTG